MQFKEWLKLDELNYGNSLAGNTTGRDRRWSQYGQMKTDKMPNPFSQAAAGISQGLGNILMQRMYPNGNQPSFGGSFPDLIAAITDSIDYNEDKEGITITANSPLIPPSEDKKNDAMAVQRHTVKTIQDTVIKGLTQSGHQTTYNLKGSTVQHVWMEKNLLYAEIRFKRINPDDYNGWNN
jgi:hypothetical protein